MKQFALFISIVLLAFTFVPAQAQEATKEFPASNPQATAPATQPEKGPGSSEYSHKSVEVYEALAAGEHYWLYTPAEPKLEKAPVIVFLHGFGALKPDGYDAWLHHLCKRGNIVIYPQWQAHNLDAPANFNTNAAASVIDAFAHLESDKTRTQPDKEDFAIAGHSAGGVNAANMAADYELLKLPKPKAVMPIQPGRAFSFESKTQKNGLIPLSKFEQIPESCLLLCVFSDSDHTVGSWCAKTFFSEATKVKADNKNLVEFISSDYGASPVIVGHQTAAAPAAAPEMIDLLDWYGYWKLLDGLTDAAFYDKNRQYALGDTHEQKNMGKYSDGRPFEELKVTKGDAKVDADAEYKPVFDRRGRRVAAPEPQKKEAEPKKEDPQKTPGRKEDDEEEEF